MKLEPPGAFYLRWIWAASCLFRVVLPGPWPSWVTANHALMGIVVCGNLASHCEWLGPVVTSLHTSREGAWRTFNDARDLCYAPANPDQVVQKLFHATKSGAILRFHENFSQGYSRHELLRLEVVLAWLKAEGHLCGVPKPGQTKV